MSGIQCGEKGVTNCVHIQRCIRENFAYCHTFNEAIVKTGPMPRAEGREPKRQVPLTGCVECKFFKWEPLDCTNKRAISKRLATWPFAKMCKHGERMVQE